MNINEAKNILNKNNYILLEASYKDVLVKIKDYFGNIDKILETLEDYIAINSPEDTKEFMETYGDETRKMIEKLIGNSYCLRDLKVPNYEVIYKKHDKSIENFHTNLKEYYLNDPKTKNDVIKAYLDYTKEIQDKQKENENLVIDAGAKIRDYQYRKDTLKERINSEYASEDVFNTWQYKNVLTNKGILCPVDFKITGEDIKQYFKENPEDYKKYGNYYANIHQYSRFYYYVDNGIDTWSFNIHLNQGSIGNTDALDACTGDAVIEGYLDWRDDNHSTWDIPYDKLVKVIKAFKNYPSKLTDEQLEQYKKNIQSYEEFGAGVAEFYATTRYQGD